MDYKSDIQIAKEAKMLLICDVAKKAGIDESDLELYGKYKAKLSYELQDKIKNNKDGKLILVTAINPTPAGEGKTTTTVGLGDGLCKIGKNAAIALREPSLGPVFGIKGGAAGGGYAQVVPMEDINLHFTGDMHAISAANNLLASMIDNHIFQKNALNFDVRKITWKRCVDMNDRQLRHITNGLGGKMNGVPREDGYDISVASEVMAVLCLSKNIKELKENISKMIVGYTFDDTPIFVCDLRAQGAMCALLRDAIKPNLVQTLFGTPAFMHGGPFANIAHGCNSIIATNTSMKLFEYTVTEAGFGADLGAEKFLNIKCRKNNISPDCVVIVATVRALKYNGGVKKDALSIENINALKVGLPNLFKHIENITQNFKLPCVVAINRFPTDTNGEIDEIKKACESISIDCEISNAWADGADGAISLAKTVVKLCESKSELNFTYSDDLSICEKINAICTKIYGANGASFSKVAMREIDKIAKLDYSHLPICMAKTQYSLSDDASKLARPENFMVTVKNVKLSAGAGFIVALTGDIMTMPGLPKVPSAEYIDVDETGCISGLF